MDKNWNLLQTQQVYSDSILKLRNDRYHIMDRDIDRDFTVIEFKDWVNIIPVTPGGNLVMIHQYRHGTREVTIEIPGGTMAEGETDPMMAARRELMEETGYSTEELIHIGTVDPNPAVQNNRCHTFLARNSFLKSVQKLDETEIIKIELMKKEKVYELIRTGIIRHALVIAAFTHLKFYEGAFDPPKK